MKPSLRAAFVEKQIQKTIEKVAKNFDFNKPLYEQLEALKKAEEILQAHYAKTVKQLNKKKGETT